MRIAKPLCCQTLSRDDTTTGVGLRIWDSPCSRSVTYVPYRWHQQLAIHGYPCYWRLNKHRLRQLQRAFKRCLCELKESVQIERLEAWMMKFRSIHRRDWACRDRSPSLLFSAFCVVLFFVHSDDMAKSSVSPARKNFKRIPKIRSAQ